MHKCRLLALVNNSSDNMTAELVKFIHSTYSTRAATASNDCSGYLAPWTPPVSTRYFFHGWNQTVQVIG